MIAIFFPITSLSMPVVISTSQSLRIDFSEVFSYRILTFDLIYLRSQKTFSHTYVLPNSDNSFTEDLSSLGKHSLKISLQKFSWTSHI